MKVFVVAVALSAVLAAAPSYAQGAAAPAGQGQARPAAPAGQTTPGAPRPAAPAPVAPQPAQHPPFPAGVKYGFVQIQAIAATSAEGKAATAKIDALQKQKVSELQEKQKALQAAQQKLDQGGSVLNEAARAQLAADIDRQNRDIQRFTEDADREVQGLQQQLQEDFGRKLTPVLAKVAQEKQLHMIFSVSDAGIVWGDPALDLTDEVVKELDAAAKK